MFHNSRNSFERTFQLLCSENEVKECFEIIFHAHAYHNISAHAIYKRGFCFNISAVALFAVLEVVKLFLSKLSFF